MIRSRAVDCIPPVRLLPITLLGVVLALTSTCSESEPAQPPTAPTAFPKVTAHADGIEFSGGLVTTGVGRRCADCHEELSRSYATSAMHNSLTLPEGEGSLEAGMVGRVIVDQPTGVAARFDVRDGRYEQTLFYADPSGIVRTSFTAAIDLVIGSGRTTRSYLQVRDGRFLVLPLVWTRAVAGPAFASGPGATERTLRTAGNLCLGCHAGDVTPIRHDASIGFAGSVSLGITCARCHGPSTEHVADGTRLTTVNPARLALDGQEQVCRQCHFSEWLTVSATDRSLASYVPGEDLADWISIFRPAGAAVATGTDEMVEFAGRGTRLRRSACFAASSATDTPLTCATCHDPHRRTIPRDAGAKNGVPRDVDRGCLSCHAPEACQSDAGKTRERACFTCHMPSAPNRDRAHVSVTDHWIRRAPPPATATSRHPPSVADVALAGGRLEDALDPAGTHADAALRAARAYVRGAEMARIVRDQDAAEWRKRAFVLAGVQLQTSADDAYALRVRGQAMTFANNAAGARPLLEAARAAEPGWTGAAADLAYAMAEDADFAAAEQLLARAQGLDPYDEDVATAHARVLVELDRREDALAVLEDLREKLGPSAGRAHLASDIANGGGDLEGALRHAYDVLMFLPREPNVQTKVGEILHALGETERARLHLTEALRLDPGFAAARRILSELRSR